MSTIYEALFEEMRDDAAIAAIVSKVAGIPSVFSGIPPTTAIAPFISFRRINYERTNSIGGPTSLSKQMMQIDCWATGNESMVALSEAVRDLVDGFRGDMGASALVQVRRANLVGQNDDPEDPTNAGNVKINRNRMDFEIWHIEQAP